jgi:VWFA-related protein
MAKVSALLGVVIAAAAGAEAQDVRFKERVEVHRVVVDARVLDNLGRPMTGLQPSDFRLKVDGRVVPVESVQWIPASAGGETTPPFPADSPNPAGRLVVFFFQKDMESSRLTGLVRMQREAVRLVDALGPDDRVAVLRYDKSLSLLLDFTTVGDELRGLVGDVLRTRPPRRLEPGRFPSLAAHFDAEAARRAATPERALQVTAEALARLPGPKAVVLAGWGLGRYYGGVVHLEPDYHAARRALVDARATVFCLDVTEADYHSLEFGLERVAEDTGGFYAKTHLFTGAAMARLEGALAGYYVLAFEGPPGPTGPHRLEIGLAGRSGRVFAKRSYGAGS